MAEGLCTYEGGGKEMMILKDRYCHIDDPQCFHTQTKSVLLVNPPHIQIYYLERASNSPSPTHPALVLTKFPPLLLEKIPMIPNPT